MFASWLAMSFASAFRRSLDPAKSPVGFRPELITLITIFDPLSWARSSLAALLRAESVSISPVWARAPHTLVK